MKKKKYIPIEGYPILYLDAEQRKMAKEDTEALISWICKNLENGVSENGLNRKKVKDEVKR